MMRWAALVVAATGCLKIPPPLAGDGGTCTNPPPVALGGGSVSFEEVGTSPLTCPVDAGALTLNAPKYRVAISPQGFVSSLQYYTDTFHEFLFHDQHTSPCVAEDGAGNAIYPVASANFDVPAVTAHVRVLSNGPAMAQAQIDWMLAYSCGGTQNASGTTTWTFYPNGRFVRHDSNVIPGQSLSSSSCGTLASCPASSSFYFTSYLALDATQLDEYGTDSVVRPLSTTMDEIDGNASSAIQCAAHSVNTSGPLIAAIPHGSSGDHTRIRFNPNGNDGNPEIAFTYDWGFMQGSLPATPRDATISYFWSDHYQCDTDLDAFATSFHNPPNLSGIRFDHATGIYVDDADHSGPFDVTYTASDADTIQGVSIELQTDRTSFQLFDTAPMMPDVMIDEGTGYLKQQIDSNHWLFWIVDQIANGNGIRIVGS